MEALCLTKIKLDVIMNIQSEELKRQEINASTEFVDDGLDLKDDKMKELHTSLYNATEYLIELFNQTGQKYSCTRTKLGKMLSIVAFKFAKEGIQIFDEDIYIYNGCGTAIDGMNAITEIAPYIKYEYEDDKEYITGEWNVQIAIEHEDIDVSINVEEGIKEVFRIFGAYSAGDLAKCINPIIAVNGITKEDGRIDLSKISELTKELIVESKDTKALLNFLFDV